MAQNVTDQFEGLEKMFHSFAVKQHCATLSKCLCDNLPDQEVDIRKAFYQFTREEEDLFNDTQVLLYNKVSYIINVLRKKTIFSLFFAEFYEQKDRVWSRYAL